MLRVAGKEEAGCSDKFGKTKGASDGENHCNEQSHTEHIPNLFCNAGHNLPKE